FYVKLKASTSYQQLAGFAAQKNCAIEKQYPYNNKTWLLKAGTANNYDGLKMANLFFESGLFEYAEPDFQLLEGTTAVPNDPLYNLQWAANNTGAANQFNGTPGGDIDLDEAWDITMGNAAIKIAVLDEGVQRTHPDLINNISPLGFGLLAGNATTGDVLSSARTHGTSCAGIIAAQANNGIGIAGVAPLSKIIPVNITINTTGNFGSSAQIAQAIDWAWDQGGADVLSNSWGGGTASSLMHDAIIRATTLGRGGKGSIVVFSTGNNNAGVASPAIFKETIAVGAMSMCNQRKSGTSCDNETFWGGNYGTGIDISAPGVKIATTRNTGTGTSPNVDYNPIFNGTSAATPFVSGVAALVLSINSNFTQQQARDIIERSAKKVGPYSYNFTEGQPNGSWTSELGHGMVNAKNAVLLAQNPAICNVTVTKPATLQVCSGSSVSLQIANHITGNTYQWRRDAGIVGSGTSFSANQTGNYDVILTTSTGCKDTSYAMPVIVSAAQGALVADAGRDTLLCLNAKSFLGGGPAGSGGTGIIHPMRAMAADLSNNLLLRFDPAQPSLNYNIIKTTLITAPQTDEFYAGAASTPYGLYMVNRFSKMLVKIDTSNGTAYNVGLTSSSALTFNGMTYDPATGKIFAVSGSSGNQLYEINRVTGAATLINTISGIGTNLLVSLSADNSGQLYALRLSTTINASAQLVTINKTTGAGAVVGGTGFLASFAQGGDADPLTDELYQTASTSVLGNNAAFSGKGLWKINKTTGFATLVGSVAEPFNQVDALSFANKEYKYQWSPATFLSNANDANPEFTATTAGSYNYTLTVTDLCGNTATDQVTIVVAGLPAAPVISPANPVLSHRNAFRENLTVTQQAGLSYTWLENGTAQANTTNTHPISFNNSTLTQFSVRATNATGCSSTSIPVSFTYAAGVLQNSNVPLTVCDSSFYDTGGPTGNTGNTFSRTFTPATAGTKLKLSLYNLQLASSAALFVYDGPDANAPRIEALDISDNSSTLQEYHASNPDGVLTVRFTLGSSNSAGWLAGLTCEQPLQFRTITGGNWITQNIWESKPVSSSTWTAATRLPNKGDELIEVRHNVTVLNELLTDDVVVTGRLQVGAGGSLRLYKVKPASELIIQTGGNFDVLLNRFVSGGTIELKGNLENSGSITAEEIIVNGNTPQQIINSGGLNSAIRKLVMNNAAGLTVQGMHEIDELALTNGLINTSANNTFSYQNISGGSASSYVNGVVRMLGNSGMNNKLIPIGKNGAYRPLLLSASSADGEAFATFQAEVMPGAPALRTYPSGISNVSSSRYYRVNVLSNPSNLRDFRITLPYGADDGVADHTILKIAKDNGAGAWINLGGTASGAAPGTIQSDEFSSFSDFVLANVVAGPVPVTLLSFSGQLQQNKALLYWSVQNEINFSRYEIERSTGGNNFTTVGSVNATGLAGYHFTDDQLPAGSILYYRLKMIDIDGTYRYSNNIVLRKEAIEQSRIVSLAPNPFRHTLNIEYAAASREKIEANIFNSEGQLMKQLNFNVTEGINLLYINGSELPAGVYLLRLKTNNQVITQKIIKR
ncbi:MAG: T9SS type A sorting domain-containing protein, partial [Chitinophagaceae bacterium]